MHQTDERVKQILTYRRYKGIAELHGHDHGSDGDKGNYVVISTCEQKGIALTQHGTLSGAVEHYFSMKSIGKTAILGIELYTDSVTSLEMPGKKKYFHTVLLAKNETGFRNLCHINFLAHLNLGYRNKPIATVKMLEKYNESLICLSGCIAGEIPQRLINGDYNGAKSVAVKLKEIFKDDFYLEVQVHGIMEEEIYLPKLVQLSKELDIKPVSTTDYHYTTIDDKIKHNVLNAKNYKSFKNKKDKDKPLESFSLPGYNYHIPKNEYEAASRLINLPVEFAAQALDSTVEIYNDCKDLQLNVVKNIADYIFPKIEIPIKGMNKNEYLTKLVFEGHNTLVKKFPHMNSKIYHERINSELEVIYEMGFASYFLLVADITTFCRKEGIMVGPGRGSVGGSYVALCLGITRTLDPVKQELLFERFINKNRKGAPDIDLDFDPERRHEIFLYLEKKHAIDPVMSNVARIIAYNKYGAKKAIRTVGPIIGIDNEIVNKIANLIPNRPGIVLEDLIDTNSKLLLDNEHIFNNTIEMRKLYYTNNKTKHFIDLAISLQGIIESDSTHPAGIVIADKAITHYAPMRRMVDSQDKNRRVNVIELSKDLVENFGLLKIDILGLKTLSIISYAVELISKKLGVKFDIDSIDLNDYKTSKETLANGHTVGVFQAESKEMTDVIKKAMQIVNSNFYDILLLVISLNRPGPKKFIPQFLENLKNPENIKYEHESLRPILEKSYGILTYQEQVSILAQKIARFSPEDSDDLRRITSKKKENEMLDIKESFIKGSKEELGCESLANKIFDDVLDFSKYAFNKSHAAAYGVLSIQTAYLKTHHPLEFMTALLTYSEDKLPIYISECKRMGIKILLPCVSKSDSKFTIEGDNIRFGLKAIKNLGSTADDIVNIRNEKGSFEDFESMLKLMKKNKVANKQKIEALIYSGATDILGLSRKSKIESFEEILENGIDTKNLDIFSHILGLDLSKDAVIDEGEFESSFKLAKEVEYLSAFISEHPLDRYDLIISNKMDLTTISKIVEINDDYDDVQSDTELESEINISSKIKDGDKVKFISYVSDASTKMSK